MCDSQRGIRGERSSNHNVSKLEASKDVFIDRTGFPHILEST